MALFAMVNGLPRKYVELFFGCDGFIVESEINIQMPITP